MSGEIMISKKLTGVSLVYCMEPRQNINIKN